MQVVCHLCRLRFDVTDPGATEVRCPRCEGKVKLDPSKLQAAHERQPLGCPSCLNVLPATDQFPTTCRYCGEKVEREAGERLGKALGGLKGKIQNELLRGVSTLTMVRQVQQLGVAEEKAFAYVDKIQLDIPFDRHKRWKEGPMPNAASTCDSCGIAGELKPYVAFWVVRPEEKERYRPGWGGFTEEELKQERPALYFLCKACARLSPEKMAQGYPARNGFTWTRLQAQKESFPPPQEQPLQDSLAP